jgi:hypothetical protein
MLFGASPPSLTALDMLIWASSTSTNEPEPSRMNSLPLEIQDRILHYAATSSVSAGKLDCILGLGSPFIWTEGGWKIIIQKRKRNRTAKSPVESQIVLDGVMSGLSYRQEPEPVTRHTRHTDLPKSVQAGLHAYH